LGNGTKGNPLRTGEVSVVTDGTSILGNGTEGNALHTGAVPVITDGTSILGNGTEGNALHTGTVPIVTDGISILGNGTEGNALHTGAVPVVTDGISILGNGTDVSPLHTSDVTVVTDGTSILGNGTEGNPLRSGLNEGTFKAAFRGGSLAAALGQPVFVGAISAPGGITTVQPAAATNDLEGSQVNGLVASINADGTVQIQTSGPLTLTTAQWDALTGESGGLVLGLPYYLALFPNFAKITETAPSSPGVFVCQIGVGLSPTTMLVAPTTAQQRLGDLTFLAAFSAVPLLGAAVRVDGPDHVGEATSDVSLEASQAVGLVVGFDITNGNRAVVQFAGKVELTPAQWAAITDTGGLIAGIPYYVDTSSHPGRLTAVKPSTGAASQVGISLNTATLLLSTPCFPQRLT